MKRLSYSLLGSLVVAGALFAQQAPPPDGDTPDEPGRPVARISVLSGDASVKRGDSSEWVAAALNVPLMVGDAVSVAAGGAVEVQLDRANFARMAGDSEMRISELENGRQQVQVARGLITWRVLRESSAQTEISTPFAAVRPGLNASVRVEVTPDGATRVTVRHGEADVYSQRGTEQIHEGDAMLVRGEQDAQIIGATPHDQWDTWNDDRDNYLQRAQSPRYVSQDIYGAEDLDSYGRWDYDASYGNVWVPRVAADWAPYREGHWVWEPFYGWTWVDYSPWGWAPFHYGSWYFRTGLGWSWFPGRRYERVWWRPALVSFVGFGGRGGGFGVGFGFGNVGWVPLAPYERFHPWYNRGGYLGNRTNVVVNNINITNTYRNSRVNGGVTAVSATDFQRGNFRNHVAVDQTHLQQAGVMRGGMPFTGTAQNMRFTDRPAAAAAAPQADFSSSRFYSRGGVQGNGAQGSQQPAQGQSRGFAQSRGTAGTSAQTNPAPRMTTNPGWQRFGSPQGSGQGSAQSNAAAGRQFGRQQPQYGAPAQQTPQSRGFYSASPQQQQSRQVPVAPPIVRQREASPNYEPRGGGFGSPYGGNRGGYSAPAPAPQYRQAPQQQYSRPAPAPQYRAAPAPQYHAAPAPAQRGGGEQRGGGGGGERGGGGGVHGRR